MKGQSLTNLRFFSGKLPFSEPKSLNSATNLLDIGRYRNISVLIQIYRSLFHFIGLYCNISVFRQIYQSLRYISYFNQIQKSGRTFLPLFLVILYFEHDGLSDLKRRLQWRRRYHRGRYGIARSLCHLVDLICQASFCR